MTTQKMERGAPVGTGLAELPDMSQPLLLPFSQLQQEPRRQPFDLHHHATDQFVDWVHNYLSKPHPDLGRPGPVCPFVPASLEKDTFHVTICDREDISFNQIRELILSEKDRFLSLEPRSGNEAQFKTIIILFPHFTGQEGRELIDKTQDSLREDFCSEGLMVGEFHNGPPKKGGLWNSDFRPLQCPVTLIAIRHMVPTDILFLHGEKALVREYLKLFNDMVPNRYKKMVEDAAERFGFNFPGSGKKKKSSAPDVLFMLEKFTRSYEIHRHAMCDDDIRVPRDFAKALGYPVERITKSLFLRNRRRTLYLLAICPAEAEVDLEELATGMGVGMLLPASDEERERKIGHPNLSMTPIGTFGIPTVIDESLMTHDTILTGSGVSRIEIEIAPDDLADITNAAVFPFLK